MKILVVDDEKLLVKGIKFNLENEGYTVDTASDGETAVELARTEEYALIILDRTHMGNRQNLVTLLVFYVFLLICTHNI
jgi:DNA-binding response OmpR family regulator